MQLQLEQCPRLVVSIQRSNCKTPSSPRRCKVPRPCWRRSCAVSSKKALPKGKTFKGWFRCKRRMAAFDKMDSSKCLDGCWNYQNQSLPRAWWLWAYDPLYQAVLKNVGRFIIEAEKTQGWCSSGWWNFPDIAGLHLECLSINRACWDWSVWILMIHPEINSKWRGSPLVVHIESNHLRLRSADTESLQQCWSVGHWAMADCKELNLLW